MKKQKFFSYGMGRNEFMQGMNKHIFFAGEDAFAAEVGNDVTKKVEEKKEESLDQDKIKDLGKEVTDTINKAQLGLEGLDDKQKASFRADVSQYFWKLAEEIDQSLSRNNNGKISNAELAAVTKQIRNGRTGIIKGIEDVRQKAQKSVGVIGKRDIEKEKRFDQFQSMVQKEIPDIHLQFDLFQAIEGKKLEPSQILEIQKGLKDISIQMDRIVKNSSGIELPQGFNKEIYLRIVLADIMQNRGVEKLGISKKIKVGLDGMEKRIIDIKRQNFLDQKRKQLNTKRQRLEYHLDGVGYYPVDKQADLPKDATRDQRIDHDRKVQFAEGWQKFLDKIGIKPITTDTVHKEEDTLRKQQKDLLLEQCRQPNLQEAQRSVLLMQLISTREKIPEDIQEHISANPHFILLQNKNAVYGKTVESSRSTEKRLKRQLNIMQIQFELLVIHISQQSEAMVDFIDEGIAFYTGQKNFYSTDTSGQVQDSIGKIHDAERQLQKDYTQLDKQKKIGEQQQEQIIKTQNEIFQNLLKKYPDNQGLRQQQQQMLLHAYDVLLNITDTGFKKEIIQAKKEYSGQKGVFAFDKAYYGGDLATAKKEAVREISTTAEQYDVIRLTKLMQTGIIGVYPAKDYNWGVSELSKYPPPESWSIPVLNEKNSDVNYAIRKVKDGSVQYLRLKNATNITIAKVDGSVVTISQSGQQQIDQKHEKGERHLQQVIEKDGALPKFMDQGNRFARNFQELNTYMSQTIGEHKTDTAVSFGKQKAKELSKNLNDLQKNLSQAKGVLKMLKESLQHSNFTDAHEKQTKEAIKKMEHLLSTVESPQVQELIKTIQDPAQWEESNIENWLKKDGFNLLVTVVLGALVAWMTAGFGDFLMAEAGVVGTIGAVVVEAGAFTVGEMTIGNKIRSWRDSLAYGKNSEEAFQEAFDQSLARGPEDFVNNVIMFGAFKIGAQMAQSTMQASIRKMTPIQVADVAMSLERQLGNKLTTEMRGVIRQILGSGDKELLASFITSVSHEGGVVLPSTVLTGKFLDLAAEYATFIGLDIVKETFANGEIPSSDEIVKILGNDVEMMMCLKIGNKIAGKLGVEKITKESKNEKNIVNKIIVERFSQYAESVKIYIEAVKNGKPVDAIRAKAQARLQAMEHAPFEALGINRNNEYNPEDKNILKRLEDAGFTVQKEGDVILAMDEHLNLMKITPGERIKMKPREKENDREVPRFPRAATMVADAEVTPTTSGPKTERNDGYFESGRGLSSIIDITEQTRFWGINEQVASLNKLIENRNNSQLTEQQKQEKRTEIRRKIKEVREGIASSLIILTGIPQMIQTAAEFHQGPMENLNTMHFRGGSLGDALNGQIDRLPPSLQNFVRERITEINTRLAQREYFKGKTAGKIFEYFYGFKPNNVSVDVSNPFALMLTGIDVESFLRIDYGDNIPRKSDGAPDQRTGAFFESGTNVVVAPDNASRENHQHESEHGLFSSMSPFSQGEVQPLHEIEKGCLQTASFDNAYKLAQHVLSTRFDQALYRCQDELIAYRFDNPDKSASFLKNQDQGALYDYVHDIEVSVFEALQSNTNVSKSDFQRISDMKEEVRGQYNRIIDNMHAIVGSIDNPRTLMFVDYHEWWRLTKPKAGQIDREMTLTPKDFRLSDQPSNSQRGETQNPPVLKRAATALEASPELSRLIIKNAYIDNIFSQVFPNKESPAISRKAPKIQKESPFSPEIKQRLIECLRQNNLGDLYFNLAKTNRPLFDIIHKSETLGRLIDNQCLESIVKNEFIESIDANGKSVKIFRGKVIGAGGMGTVEHVALLTSNGKDIEFGAIKKPHSGAEKTFQGDIDGANLMQTWGHQNFNKPLVVDPQGKFIIFETLEGARDVHNALRDKKVSRVEIFDTYLQILDGLEFLHRQGYFHGDLKNANVIFGQENGQTRAQIIDNTPRSANAVFEWFPRTLKMNGDKIDIDHSPCLLPNKIQEIFESFNKNKSFEGKNDTEIKLAVSRYYDIRSFGFMLEEAMNAFGYSDFGPLQKLAASCKDRSSAIHPDFLMNAKLALQRAIDKNPILETAQRVIINTSTQPKQKP